MMDSFRHRAFRIGAVLFATALGLTAQAPAPAPAGAGQVHTPPASYAPPKAKAKPRAIQPKAPTHRPVRNLVDVNSASREALMKLPGIDGALADKIIAGRPYLSKAKLVTQNVLTMKTYAGLKDGIMAASQPAKK